LAGAAHEPFASRRRRDIEGDDTRTRDALDTLIPTTARSASRPRLDIRLIPRARLIGGNALLDSNGDLK